MKEYMSKDELQQKEEKKDGIFSDPLMQGEKQEEKKTDLEKAKQVFEEQDRRLKEKQKAEEYLKGQKEKEGSGKEEKIPEKKDNEKKLGSKIRQIKKNLPPPYRDAYPAAVIPQEPAVKIYESGDIQKLLDSRRSLGIGDSGEMDLVKRQVRILYERMSDMNEKVFTSEDIAGVLQLYKNAIDACRAYVEDPKKNKKSRRWQLVDSNLKRFTGEAEKLEKAKEMIEENVWADKQTSLSGLLSGVDGLSKLTQKTAPDANAKAVAGKRFHFKEDYINEKAERGDNRETIEKLRAKLDSVNQKNTAEISRLEIERNAEFDKVSRLKGRQEYTGPDGKTVAYKKKETPDEYKLRVNKKIVSYYDTKKARLRGKAENIQQKIRYYENSLLINTVDLEQVDNTLSEQLRRTMKQSLALMAETDRNRRVPVKVKRKYFAFFDAVDAYTGMEAKYTIHRGRQASYESGEALEEEAEAFVAMQKALSGLEKDLKKYLNKTDTAEGKVKLDVADRDLLAMIENYRGLFAGMSEGNLKVEEGAEIIKARGAFYNRDGEKVEAVSKKDEPLFAHEPAISDVVQGYLGDCYFVSALASMVSKDQSMIKDSMKDNGDGTVTVRFYRPSVNLMENEKKYVKRPIYINVPKQDLKGNAAKGALWVSVLEQAYHQYLRQAEIRSEAVNGFAGQLSGELKRQYTQKLELTKERVKTKLDGLFGEEDRSAQGQIRNWELVNQMEDLINGNPVLAEKYKTYLDKKQKKEEKADIDARLIEGGNAANVFSAFTGQVHKVHHMDFARHSGRMNDLSYPYKNLQDVYWKEHPIEGLKAAKKRADRERVMQLSLPEGIKELNSFFTLLNMAEDHLKKNGEKRFGEKKMKKLNEMRAQKEAKEKLLAEKMAQLRECGFNSMQEFYEAPARIGEEETIEKLADLVVERYLSSKQSSGNLAQGEYKYKAFMTMDQMRKLIGEIHPDRLDEDQEFTTALNDIYTTGETQELYRGLNAVKDHDARIMEAVRTILGDFIANAEKNTVLNHEHFSGYYSREADDVFDEIKKAVSERKAVVGGTYRFVGDRAEKADTGEMVYNGLASTHEYSIIGVKTMEVPNPAYMKNGDERKTLTHKFVRIRNPWATTHVEYQRDAQGKVVTVQKKDDVTGGVDEIELNEFMNRFSRIYSTDF